MKINDLISTINKSKRKNAVLWISAFLFIILLGGNIYAQKTIGIPMRDGIKLATDLYFPEGEKGPFPVILMRTPYNKVILQGYGEYFSKHGGVKSYIDHIIQEAQEKGCVTTLFNRRRYLPEINSPNRPMRQFAERTAINTPIQGTAADLIKIAMIRIHRRLSGDGFSTKMILQVHDELVFEAPDRECEPVSELIREEMEGVMKMSVPLRVSIGCGKSWGEAHS